jgi:paraquat-inducible protein A
MGLSSPAGVNLDETGAKPVMPMNSLMACHDCDLLQRLPPMAMGVVAECPRCGAILRRTQFNSINRTIGWLIAGLILYVVAVSFPFLAMQAQGIANRTALTSGIFILYRQGMGGMGMVVLLTCLVFPLFTMVSQLYVLVPLQFGRTLPMAAPLFALIQRLRPWGMMEVYLLGILVSMVKLAKLARITPGPSLFSFIALVFVLAASSVSLDKHLVWEHLDPYPAGEKAP